MQMSMKMLISLQMSMEMLKIYQFFDSEQHANVHGNVNVMEHANMNGNVKNTSIYCFRSGTTRKLSRD